MTKQPTSSNRPKDTRLLRYSPEAERRVVGAILLDGGPVVREVQEILYANHFMDPTLRLVYAAALALQYDGAAVDLVTVVNHLRNENKLQAAGGSAGLAALLAQVPTSADAMHHAKIIVRHAIMRDLHSLAIDAASQAEHAEPDVLLRDTLARVQEMEARLDQLDQVKAEDAIWSFADVEAELGSIEWLWRGFLPKGFLCLLAGVDGIGKSKVALALGATVIRGDPWPDGTKLDPAVLEGYRREVMYVDTEASHAVNIERIKALGLPLEGLYWHRDPRHPDDKMQDILLDDPLAFALYERTIRSRKPGLVILDAFRGLFTGDENSSRDTWFIKRVSKLARDSGSTVLLLQHVTKRRPDQPLGIVEMDNIRGSTAIRQTCRSIMALDRPDPEDALVRFRSLKITLGPMPKAIGMEVAERLHFHDRVPEVPKKETSADKAAQALKDLLENEGGRMVASEVFDLMAAGGHSKDATRKAKEKLRVDAIQDRDGDRNLKAWFWVLPGKGKAPAATVNGKPEWWEK